MVVIVIVIVSVILGMTVLVVMAMVMVMMAVAVAMAMFMAAPTTSMAGMVMSMIMRMAMSRRRCASVIKPEFGHRIADHASQGTDPRKGFSNVVFSIGWQGKEQGFGCAAHQRNRRYEDEYGNEA